MKRFEIASLYDLTYTRGEFLANYTYPWEVLSDLAQLIRELGNTLPKDEFEEIAPEVWVAKDATVAPNATVMGPCIIDHGAEIRHCAYLRGSVLIGKGSVVGNSTEVKNAVVFDHVQIPHFNYVGDSVLGHRSHMGAGSVCSNVKSDKTLVSVSADGKKYPTGRKKFGAMLGDGVEVGCNSVLCPGTVIGKNATVYPLSRVRGYVPENSIFKNEQTVIQKQ
ncbi:MAG: UDP-N-acetylglucosamine pyrophosphorylase [Clostridia bacterium]|nr:UDP-N-acetylglucosamine pyrophosphorylase [Clostridia bacterium]MBQ1965529.1 UDP-N-acetylglucosamine pyrophosphorylase [Clostridia bacterium]MBQ5743342.1 UDP-N-acetylglucosamine pyrophosphorylase [Clostridia bacterium]